MKKRIFTILIVIYFLAFLLGFIFFAEYNSPIIFNICLFVLDFSSIISLCLILKKDFIKIKKINSLDYFRTLDFKIIKPIEAGYIIKKSNLNFNTVLIIIFELIEKKILVKKYIDNRLYISLRNGITLDEIDMLLNEEKNIIKLIFNGTDDNNKYDLAEIIDYLKNDINSKHYLDLILNDLECTIRNKYYCSICDIGGDIKNFYKIICFYMHASTIPFIFPLIGIICGIKITNNIIIMIILYLLNLFLFTIWNIKYTLKNEYLDEISKLKGLYNFINDFSNIKNLDINYIEIYDKYYLYALSFGLTDKVEEKYDFNSIDDNIKRNLKFLFHNNDYNKG